MTNPDRDLVLLLQTCLEKNRRADWEDLADLLQPIVTRGVWRALARFGMAGGGLANDLVQDVFLKLCERDFAVLRASRADTNAVFEGYLRSIAGTTVTDHYRKESSQKMGSGKEPVNLESLEQVLPAADNLAQAAEHRQLIEWVGRCLETQKEKNRTVFWLYHRQGYSPKDIAALPGVGMGRDGVETLLRRMSAAALDCLRRNGVLKDASE